MADMYDNRQTGWLGKEHLHFEQLSSTNDYLKQNAAALSHGTVATADFQTAGKGRSGRAWQDNARAGLAFSVLLRPPSVHHTQLLPLVCALAVKSAIYSLYGVNSGIKWPNDIVLNKKKLCGILCEGVLLGQTAYAVCGIGINVMQQEADFHKDGLDHATSLLVETGMRRSVDEVAAAVMIELERYYDRYITQGIAALLSEYEAACVTLGRQVKVIQNGAEREGRAVGLTQNGALLVDFAGIVAEINAGEASVRGLYGYV